MSVTVRPYRQGGWMVDLKTRLANGSRYRERRRLIIRSRSAAQRRGEDRERHLLQHGLPPPTREVPTLEQFAPRFLDGHARANRQKPSGIAAKETILRTHLIPLLGHKKLDAITTEQVQQLKRGLDRKPKTVNNVLAVLSVMMKKAVEWEVIERLPCSIRLLPIPKPSASFHDFDDYERLVTAAERTDPRAYVIVLLGGEAGLRCGEMMALEWGDVDLTKRQLCVQRSEWKGHVTTPKGGRLRYVPLTTRLTAALRTARHLRGARVLCESDGQALTQRTVQGLVRRAARRADLRNAGVHVLRHTFCSHLAMKGAGARAIQELAGHQDLTTTQRYMHVSPAAVESAIRLLEPARGNMVATASVASENNNKQKGKVGCGGPQPSEFGVCLGSRVGGLHGTRGGESLNESIRTGFLVGTMPRFRALIAETKDVELFVVSAGTGFVNPDLARRRFSRRTRAVRWRRAP